MRLPDKAVIRVLAGIHGAHAIELAHQHRGEQMIHREGIRRMAGEYLFEALDRRIVVEVVKALEGILIQRIGGTERRGDGRVNGCANPSQNQQSHCGKSRGKPT